MCKFRPLLRVPPTLALSQRRAAFDRRKRQAPDPCPFFRRGSCAAGRRCPCAPLRRGSQALGISPRVMQLHSGALWAGFAFRCSVGVCSPSPYQKRTGNALSSLARMKSLPFWQTRFLASTHRGFVPPIHEHALFTHVSKVQNSPSGCRRVSWSSMPLLAPPLVLPDLADLVELSVLKIS